MESKSLFLSVTFWGVIAGLLSAILKKYGFVIDEAGLTNDAVTLASAVVAIWGRWRASRPVSVGGVVANPKEGGFVRSDFYPWLIVLAIGAVLAMTYGCAGPRAAVPKTIPEQVEAANLLVDKLSDGIVDVTCTKFKAGQCVEPGKPLMPDDAIKAHESVQRAHAALMMTSGIPVNGVGECLGKQRSQIACLAAASALLTEVDRMLIARKGVQ